MDPIQTEDDSDDDDKCWWICLDQCIFTSIEISTHINRWRNFLFEF